MVRDRPELVLHGCRRCHRHHVVALPDGTSVDPAPIAVESPCPHDGGRRVWVSLGATAGLLRMNTRNLAAFLARLEVERERHRRRAVRADAKAAKLRAVVEAEGDGFRVV